jgi:alpha-N-arabinofuranosidase
MSALLLLTAWLASPAAQTPNVANLSLDFHRPGVAVSPNLYGLMTEEINHSYDGGLYGELIQNRAFRDSRARAVHWSSAAPGAELVLEQTGGPTNGPLVHFSGAIANDGYWGFPVRPRASYTLTLWARASRPGPLAVTLESPNGQYAYAIATLRPQPTWQRLTATLRTGNLKPTKDARLVLRSIAPTDLGYVSLFQPTFKGRPGGFRPDLMEKLVAMRPKFLRFPGGNYVEGNTIAERFDWKRTIGPVEARIGHQAPWGYRSTDGMGLLEFLEWCEDMHAKPLLAVFAGYALNGQHVQPGRDLEPYVQDALDEIEYVTGGPETNWGAQRIQNGHPSPFSLVGVEIGNEDGFDRSGTYGARFNQFYDAIKKRYPKLNVISTTGGNDPIGARVPMNARQPDLIDEHYYSSTWDMIAMASKYDAYPRSGPKIFVGEWASFEGAPPWVQGPRGGPTPNLACALTDAAFMTGFERNSDVVKMACYAPLFVNVNPGARQWAINLIGYDALESFGSPSYYTQVMFSQNLGDTTVPLTLSNGPTQVHDGKIYPGLFASATRTKGQLFIKLVNTLPSEESVRIDLDGAGVSGQVTVTTLTGSPSAVNSLASPMAAAPMASSLPAQALASPISLPPSSITVLKVPIRSR